MKLKAIAEGVENIKQQGFLEQNGCFVIQEFYYSPAIPTENSGTYQKIKPHCFKQLNNSRFKLVC